MRREKHAITRIFFVVMTNYHVEVMERRNYEKSYFRECAAWLCGNDRIGRADQCIPEWKPD